MTAPSWMAIALKELGVREIPGAASNPRVLEYHATTTLKATSDAVPWCSAFLCWVMQQAGQEHPASAAARHWLQWGDPTGFPEIGSVVVLKREGVKQPGPEVLNAPGHVGLFVGFSVDSRVLILAGNQGDQVSIGSFPAALVLGYRVAHAVREG